MKNLLLILSLLIVPLSHYGQSLLDIKGTWQVKVNETSFCNVIMIEDGWNGKPLVVLEGMLNNHKFQIRCRVEEINQRQAIALYELADEKGNKKYDSSRPLICFVKKAGGNIATLWCQIGMTKGRSAIDDKGSKVKKITIPNYKEKYRFVPFEETTASLTN